MEITEKDKQRFWDKVEKTSYCWNWTGAKANNGYGNFWHSKRHEKAHRFSYLIHYGNLPKNHDAYICHSCDNPSCVNPKHLWRGTPLQNQIDMKSKGRARYAGPIGNLNSAKLTLEQAREIYYSPKRQIDLSEEYNISRPVVCRIKKGLVYKQIHG